MNRTRYVVRDATGVAVAEILTPEGEDPEVEPWMAHNLLNRGWSIEKYVTVKSDVDVHGLVDWRTVAEALATPLRMMLADDVPAESEEEVEDIYASAQQALDDFDVAIMEASMTALTMEPERPAAQQEEKPDGKEDEA